MKWVVIKISTPYEEEKYTIGKPIGFTQYTDINAAFRYSDYWNGLGPRKSTVVEWHDQ